MLGATPWQLKGKNTKPRKFQKLLPLLDLSEKANLKMKGQEAFPHSRRNTSDVHTLKLATRKHEGPIEERATIVRGSQSFSVKPQKSCT